MTNLRRNPAPPERRQGSGLDRFLTWLDKQVADRWEAVKSADANGNIISHYNNSAQWNAYSTARAMFKKFVEEVPAHD